MLNDLNSVVDDGSASESGPPSEPSTNDVRERWMAEIEQYDREFLKWTTRCRKLLKRYRDNRAAREESQTRFNIFWSNVETLKSALYARDPKPDIERRVKEKDALARIVADVLERCATYTIACHGFSPTMRQVVSDRLLPGRGVAWVRYCPEFRDATVEGTDEVKDDGVSVTNATDSDSDKPEALAYEYVATDYVYWEDFGHTTARTWAEVRAVWKRVYMDRDELVKRFGAEKGGAVVLDYSPRNLSDEKVTETLKKATVYEIWDKSTRKALWIAKGYKGVLDEADDPLGLKDFFPCPRPLFATLTTDSLVPVPDYAMYQDQAAELDELTARIAALTKSIKAAGVYDASAEGLQRLLNEGVENQLIPVDNWAAQAEKGGLKGSFELLDVRTLAETLMNLYEARDKVKQDIYEITGIADIVRGNSDPGETATAQQIKGQFATLRLSEHQTEVQRFARDLVRLISEIIAEHFSLETIKLMSGVKLLTQEEKQMAQAAMQAQQPLPEDVQKLLAQPSWEDVIAVLRDDALRNFRIDIETDSTIRFDEQQEKNDRVEFLTAAGGFLQQAVVAAQEAPQIAPLLGELLMFGVRGFRTARSLEPAFEDAMQQLRASGQQPKPDPEMQKIQAQMQLEQFKVQAQKELEAAKQTFQAQENQHQQQIEAQKAQVEAELQAQLERHKAEVAAQQAQAVEAIKAQHENLRLAAQIESNERIKALENDTKLKIEQMRMAHEARIKAAEIETQTITTDKQIEADREKSKSQDKAKSAQTVTQLASKLDEFTKRLAEKRRYSVKKNDDGSLAIESG